jgi:hypothetical protein
MKSDLTFEFEQIVKKSNGGTQMTPSHVLLELKEYETFFFP